jgi:para-aminobenzoate synthetase component 1
MMWSVYNRIILMVCILRIFFFQPKKIFLLRGNELEIQYLTMCEEDIDEDLDEINTKRRP